MKRILMFLCCAVAACIPTPASEGEGEGEAPVLLGSGTGLVGNERLPYELWRAPRTDGGSTFVQWVPAPSAGPRPVVVVTMPYDGVDWTGEAVDERFAQRGAGFVTDDGCVAENDDGIQFSITDPDDAAGNAFIYNFNDVGVLLVYGRFYACDGIDGDVLDMQAALSFLTTVADADTSWVATAGSSWGGFLALYGAARVPDGVNVVASAAVAPPADMARMVRHTDELAAVYPADLQPELAFFAPYLRRITSATGGLPGAGDFSAFSTSSLCEGLGATELLLLHDEWDTLVPFDGSVDVVEACGKDGLFWRRQTPVDYHDMHLEHGAFTREPGYPSVFTFQQAYVALRVVDGPLVYVLAAPEAVSAFLLTVHGEQAAGGDVREAEVRLREFVDPRLQVFDVVNNVVVSAASLVAAGVNAHWGTTFDEVTIRTQLQTGLPAL